MDTPTHHVPAGPPAGRSAINYAAAAVTLGFALAGALLIWARLIAASEDVPLFVAFVIAHARLAAYAFNAVAGFAVWAWELMRGVVEAVHP